MRSLLSCLVLSLSACAGGYRTVGPVEHVGPPGAELANDPLQRQLDHALRARAALRARLVAFGAIPRPPRPASIAETPGDAPFSGARWMHGRWVWEADTWGWHAGYWTDVAHDEIYEREMFGGEDVYYGSDLFSTADTETVRDHRRDREWFGPRLRDHRSDEPATTIRDHRDHEDDSPSPTIRDHRDDKQDDKSDDDRHQDDDGFGRIRDHRR
jgi:hypothetical protein